MPGDADALQVAALGLRAHDLAAPLASAGELTCDAAPVVRFASGVRVPLDPKDWGLASALQRAFDRAGLAPSAEDSARRDASGGAFRVEGLDLAASGVLDAVRDALFPGDAEAPRAELRALALYGAGEPRAVEGASPGAEGTLVLSAPSSYEGGDMVLTASGLRERFQSTFYRGATQATFPWVAWRGAVDHRVEAVSSGARITLTWSLHRAGGPRPLEGASHTERFTRALVESLADADFAAEGVELGFACTRSYAGELAAVRADDRLAEASLRVLDGRDRAVAAAALRLGVEVRLVPYLVEARSDLRWALARTLTAAERVVCRRKRLSPAAIVEALPVAIPCDRDAVVWAVAPCTDGASPDVDAVAERMGATEFSETGDFERESAEGEMFLHTALVLRVPPVDVRRPRVEAYRAALVEVAKPAAPPKEKAPPKAAKPPAPPPPKPAPPAPKKAAVKVVPKEELTAAQLRALGYGPAEVKRLVADGTLEKTGFGWYRFLRAPA
jgi:hypothetical protein